jgi:hypothetical protein
VSNEKELEADHTHTNIVTIVFLSRPQGKKKQKMPTFRFCLSKRDEERHSRMETRRGTGKRKIIEIVEQGTISRKEEKSGPNSIIFTHILMSVFISTTFY